MNTNLIDATIIDTAFEKARDDLPRLVERYSLYNRLDAHHKASLPGMLLSTLEIMSFFASSGSLTKDKAYDYLGSFDNTYRGKSCADLGETLSNHIRKSLGLDTIRVSATSLTHVERMALKNIAQFTNLTESASNPHISVDTFSNALIQSASNVLNRSKTDPSMYMGDFEKDLLSREILYFSEAKKAKKGEVPRPERKIFREASGFNSDALRHFHHSPVEKMPASNNPYRVSMISLRGVDVLNAYELMKSKSSSAGYKNAVSIIFSELADTLSRQAAPSR